MVKFLLALGATFGIIFSTFVLYFLSSQIGFRSHKYHTTEQIPVSPELLQEYKEKFDFYLQLATERHVDKENGFFNMHCDSLLFSSLAGAAGAPLKVDAAMEENGKWHRTPQKDCYSEHSGSTISRDMLLGLLVFLWKSQNKDLLETTISYGKANATWSGDWKMGDGDPFRIYMRPALQSTYYQALYKMDGESNWRRHIPYFWTYTTGYGTHLMVWHITMAGLLRGGLKSSELKMLKKYADREPRNGIYNAAYAKFSGSAAYLHRAFHAALDETLFPADSLPTSSNFCVDALWQRDEFLYNTVKVKEIDENGNEVERFKIEIVNNPHWTPCPHQNREHPGIEIIIMGALVFDMLYHE
jgi:hypothetical protein